MLIFLSVSGAELVDSVLDVVRKEAESCDCLQVSFVISVYGWNEHFATFKTMLGLVYLLPGAGETFSFTPNVTGAGCHGGWTISLNLLLASFWHGETLFKESPISENASLQVCWSTLDRHWGLCAWRVTCLTVRAWNFSTREYQSKYKPQLGYLLLKRSSVIIVSNMIITPKWL